MIRNDYKSSKKLMTRIHFNRIEMQRGGDHVWTIHNSQGCFQVKEVQILTPLVTIYKPLGVQPRAYFKGLCRVEVKEGIGIVR